MQQCLLQGQVAKVTRCSRSSFLIPCSSFFVAHRSHFFGCWFHRLEEECTINNNIHKNKKRICFLLTADMDDDSSGDKWLSLAADHGTNKESDNGGGGKPATVIAPLPIETTTTPSTNECRTIWDDDMVLLDRSTKRWTCRWCKNTFVVNATKAVAHLSKTQGNEVQICPMGMDEFHRKRYAAFQQALDHKQSLKKAVIRQNGCCYRTAQHYCCRQA